MLSFLPWLEFDLALIQSIKLLYISYDEPEAAVGGSHFRECTACSHEVLSKNKAAPIHLLGTQNPISISNWEFNIHGKIWELPA